MTLPYWDWAADGQKTASQQKKSKVWAADAMGGSGSPVKTGPFRFNATDPATFVAIAAGRTRFEPREIGGVSFAIGAILYAVVFVFHNRWFG